MTTARLYNLDRPDELGDLKLKDADREEIIKATFKALYEMADENYYHRGCQASSPEVTDIIYQWACQMIRPFKKRLKGSLHTDELDISDTEKDSRAENAWKKRTLVGVHASALLNETDISELVVGKKPRDGIFQCMSYRLKPGKAVLLPEISNAVRVGESAEGGTVINRMKKHRDPEQVGGYLVEMGDYASGGVWINCNWTNTMGLYASGGTWLNFGSVGYLGQRARGGVFVTRTKPEWGFLTFAKKDMVYAVGPEELTEDTHLSQLMDEAEKASETFDVPKVNKLARKIDTHVRENYQPRKIA